ncbi:MAG TPA: glycosyltransferase family 4 protein [Verrucomicrobiae bacterium]
MHVAFINENMLGHSSYLMPFVRWFEAHPEAGIQPHVIDAAPLPAHLQRSADMTIRGLRKVGLDFHSARWRLISSQHVRNQLDKLRSNHPIDAVVVNTQSVALQLEDVAGEMPVCVCLDATFHQLAHSRWFAPNKVASLLVPLTMAPIASPERALFHSSAKLFPWCDEVADSLRKDYGEPAEKVQPLPPSLDLMQLPFRSCGPLGSKPRLLFIGGDFARKGGPLLLEVFRQHLSTRAELHIVTQSPINEEQNVKVHRNVKAYSPEWHALWSKADAFVFPSTLETFGLVLLEAMAFGVPLIAAPVGAARELIGNNERGLLLDDYETTTLKKALDSVLEIYPSALRRAEAARAWVEQRHNLTVNAGVLATTLRQLSSKRQIS